MQKYIFENKEETEFANCSEEKKLEIVKAIAEGRCEKLNRKDSSWAKKPSWSIFFREVYRTLAPVPIPYVIDWPQVPPQFRYFFANRDGMGSISEKLPVEHVQSEMPALAYAGSGDLRNVNPGQYGFKRGTVASINSLIVRPIGV